MDGKVAAGLLTAMCEVAEAQHGLSRAALLDAMGLEPADVVNPSLLLPGGALPDLLSFLLEQTRDPAVGFRLGVGMSDMFDLRAQGFWGYALLSSLTLRQRIDLHVRYQRLRSPTELSMHVEGDVAVMELKLHGFSAVTSALLLDSTAACAMIRFQRFFQPRRTPLTLWLACPERAHHRELRALVHGQVIFGAPRTRVEFPAAELDFRFQGDPYLSQLACAELDSQIARVSLPERHSLVHQVRDRIAARLDRGVALVHVARDLRLSARTLQRQLGELGASFQELLEEVRRSRALAYLSDTDEAVEGIAARLGYGDPANFRRAFRRWTGMAPSGFRAERRANGATGTRS